MYLKIYNRKMERQSHEKWLPYNWKSPKSPHRFRYPHDHWQSLSAGLHHGGFSNRGAVSGRKGFGGGGSRLFFDEYFHLRGDRRRHGRVGDRQPVFRPWKLWKIEENGVYSAGDISGHQCDVRCHWTGIQQEYHDCHEYAGGSSGYVSDLSADLFPGTAVFIYV